MKTQKDWHKYGSFALLFGFITGICSGMTKHKKLHAASAFLTGFGIVACIYSGHKLIGEDMPEESKTPRHSSRSHGTLVPGL